MKPQLVYIEWVDSISHHSWNDLKQYENTPDKIKTVGWIVAKDKQATTVVGSLTRWMGCGDMTIPNVCIKRIVKMREPR